MDPSWGRSAQEQINMWKKKDVGQMGGYSSTDPLQGLWPSKKLSAEKSEYTAISAFSLF